MVERISPKNPHAYRAFLKEWRNSHKLTLEEVADRIGTTKGTIQRMESGEREPYLGYLAAFSEALKIPIEKLFRHPQENSSPIRSAEEIMMTLRRIEGLNDRGVELAYMAIETALEANLKPTQEQNASDDQSGPASLPHASSPSQ